MTTRQKETAHIKKLITDFLKQNGDSRIEPIAKMLGMKVHDMRHHIEYLYNNHYINKIKLGGQGNVNLYKFEKLFGVSSHSQNWDGHYEIFNKMIRKAVKERKHDDQV